MSETKTLVFPDSGNNNGMMSILASLCQQKGVDPNVLLAMRNNSGFGGEGGWFMWVIFLFFLMGWGGNGFGFGNRGGQGSLENLINNDNGRELLMSAIQGNGNAINQLSSNLNCSTGQIQQAISALMTQVQGVGNQVGMSAQQIINSIQAGNCSIASQLASCCCDIKGAITGINTGLERGFSSVAFETQRQTCDITGTIKDSTAQILAGQRAAEMREMQDKLDHLREENGAFKSSAMTSQIVAQATAPLGAALGDLSSRLAKIECKQPETVTLPYSPVVGVPNCLAAQFGLYGGLPFGGVPGFWG